MEQPRYYAVDKSDRGYCVHFANKQGLSIDEIKRIFSEFGEVLCVRKAGDDYGYRFVRYKNLEDVERCVEEMKNHKTIRLLPKRPKNNDQNGGQRKNWNNRQETRTSQSGGQNNYENSGKRNYNQNNGRYRDNKDDAGQTDENNERKSWDNDGRKNEFRDTRNNRWDNEDTRNKSRTTQSANENWCDDENKNAVSSWDNIRKEEEEASNKSKLTQSFVHNWDSDENENAVNPLYNVQNEENLGKESWEVQKKEKINADSKDSPSEEFCKAEIVQKKQQMETESLDNNIKKLKTVATDPWNSNKDGYAEESNEKIFQEVIPEKEETESEVQLQKTIFQSLQSVNLAPLRSPLPKKSLEILNCNLNTETSLIPPKDNDFSGATIIPVKHDINLPIPPIPEEIFGKDNEKLIEKDVKILKPKIIRAVEVIVANIEINFGVNYILHLFEKYGPISATGIKVVPGAGIRYCIVYFESQGQALAVEQEFDNFKLSGLNLIVLRVQQLVKISSN